MQMRASNSFSGKRRDEFPHRRATIFSARAVSVSGLALCEEDAMKHDYVLAVLLIGGMAAALFGVADAQNERISENISVLRAQKIELVDERGVMRARLSSEPDGEVVLRLRSETGRSLAKTPSAPSAPRKTKEFFRVSLGVPGALAGVRSGNANGELRVKLERASVCSHPEVCSGHYFPFGIESGPRAPAAAFRAVSRSLERALRLRADAVRRRPAGA
jgi:hypothetical protein